MFIHPDARDVADPVPASLRAARTVEETGLPFLFLVELLVKVLFQRGQLHLPELASYVKLSLVVIDPVISFMRQEKMCEVTRRGASGTDADIHYQLTDSGRQRALECLARNAYAGPCPVPLAAYNAQVAAQSVASMHVTRADVQANFDGIAVNARVLDQLGSAMNSGRAIFIHGAAGSGKTYLAERLSGLLQGSIAVPYAIMVDGEVVPFYDPVLHVPAGEAQQVNAGIEKTVQLDARWVRGVRRPAVLTGGELTLDMLDLRFDSVTRLYRAPPHLKANNGIFIIDDLGRQRCSPLELMNRWIVPMDRAIDFLSLHNGYTFQVPFDVVVVFSSNFLPERLSDAAFLRRLGYKIEVPALSESEYEQVFAQTCARYGVAFDAQAFRYLLHQLHYRCNVALLACYPRDLIRQVRDLARYEGTAMVLNDTVLEWAWNNYFAGASQRSGSDNKTAQERREPTTIMKSEEMR
ncbi:ATP-binding protein [Janthinobacterium sp.]|uniref:ATP-binding protein n=1 Tax=Janthinobacterium sp. TaxID=1871054 RepID=UPI0028978D94|nr:ATP-binding protein [Janthinobacterium sp.]